MKAFTDYPVAQLGDVPGKLGPIREVDVRSFDGDRYCYVEIQAGNGESIRLEIKTGYLYSEHGKHGEVPVIDVSQLPLNV